MTDFKQPHPKHNPFYCCTDWHLWMSGLSLAIYSLAGSLTRSGTDGRTFHPQITHVSKYFGSSYSATTRAVRELVKKGWLIRSHEVEGHQHYQWVSHKEWAAQHPDGCVKRDLFHWQETLETNDPLVKRLYACSQGRLRLYANLVDELHTFDEEQLVGLYVKEVAAAMEKRKRGNWDGTKMESCLWRVVKYLRPMRKMTVEGTP